MACCIVCYRSDPPHRAVFEASFFPCRHKAFACPACWDQYILVCLETPSKPIKCIQPGCKHLLTEEEVIKRAKADTCSKYLEIKSREQNADQDEDVDVKEATLGPKPVKVCPSMGCMEVMQKDSLSEHTTCPECFHEFCWLCLAAIKASEAALEASCKHEGFCPLRKGGPIAMEKDERLFGLEAEAIAGDEMTEGWEFV
ncbi:hypothetical protein CERZMDRAFT_92997 [Cercospora zeae-maydis SCOH1-5]|uniref:RING-type domain-containing protein n=1 Tax=Cercospora zeae-maydis SCOH1-5 TaxID=717836 RepID=A0A6A6FTY8_9PEZI|nr:hypothetical protein CERZMDRAFT_92997 [Cercospora zeae-maydis SCOH1-5]